jgi:hypothetical protein
MLQHTFKGTVNQVRKMNLHCRLENVIDKYATYYRNNPEKNKHLIFYGPPGCGKYSQVLYMLSKINSNALDSDKRLSVTNKNKEYNIRISAIHCEVDMQLLSCNAKALWYSIYNYILEIMSSNINDIRYIVCKNFEYIHAELLDVFYFYIRNIISTPISFIIITSSYSFIPESIQHVCELIRIKRPIRQYRLLENKRVKNPLQITNIQYTSGSYQFSYEDHHHMADILYKEMRREKICFHQLREAIYSLFTYHINIHDVLMYIIQRLKNECLLDEKSIICALESFYEGYYNNYRSIFHMERIILHMIQIIKNLETKA